MKNKKTKFNYYRLILQWAVLLLLVYMVGRLWTDTEYTADFEAYCPFGGLLAFSSFLANGSLACSMTSMQIVMGFTLMLGIVVFSKLFCSFICPVGTITEWLGDLGRKWKVHYFPKGFADRGMRIFKYVLLFITFYFTIKSSELFCKKFDPYYASFTGFSEDVDLVLGLLALFITVLGSVFINQFWCKYFCPLGAVSNIFTYFPVFLLVFGIYATLVFNDFEVSWIIPMTVVIVVVFLMEAVRLKDGIIIPLFRITRNDKICNTNCKLCDKACPQGITVSTCPSRVNHIDCNLCGDCLVVCPRKDALQINKRSMIWFPALVTLILVISGFYWGRQVEIPTVNENWGTDEQFDRAGEYEKTGLKNIKCFGSSMGFVSQMQEIDGIIGVKTFVSSHSVKVYFDPEIIDEQAVKEAVFSPKKFVFYPPDSQETAINCSSFFVNHFFDKYDLFYLTKILEKQEGVLGFETRYGEPVEIKIFYENEMVSQEMLKEAIEAKDLAYEVSGEKFAVSLNYEVASINSRELPLSGKDFVLQMFRPYLKTFKRSEGLDSTDIDIYEISMPDAVYPQLNKWFPYLESHLTEDSGVVAFETRFLGENPVARVYFNNKYTSGPEIFSSLNQEMLEIKYSDGETDQVKNPFDFSEEGRVVKND